MKLCYIAHPVSAPTRAGIEHNLAQARYYYTLLSDSYRDRSFTANWILNCECFEETEENRALGMQRNFVELKRCDELFLVGPHISKGMQEEIEVFDGTVYNFVNLDKLPSSEELELHGFQSKIDLPGY